MKPILRSAVLLATFALSQVASAADNCTTHYIELNRTISRGYISESTQAQVDRIFADPKIPSNERAKQAFDAIVNDRLRLLDEASQADLRGLLTRIHKEYQGSGSLWAVFDGQTSRTRVPNQDNIKMKIPESFRESIIEYAALTHEFEHGIQAASERARFKNKPIPVEIFEALYYGPGRNFHGEAGAMLAEYQFLNAIPEPARLEMRKAIENSPVVSDFDKKMVLRWLDHKPNAAAHVKAEHDAGRYDRANATRLRNDQFQGFAMYLGIKYGLPAGGAGLLVSGGALYHHCKAVASDKQLLSKTSPLVRDLCKQFPGINF